MVPMIRSAQQSRHFEEMLLQFVETVIVHQFPKWTRREIEKMLQVTDVRETRVYQEALEEGMEKGMEKGIEAVAKRLLEMGRPVAEIAQATGLTATQIRKLGKKSRK
jgi:predicted transposase/invertase (TIGR01784 family)